MGKTGAVILAAGQGKRMNSSVAKQFLMLDGKPVIYYALKAFEDSPVDTVVLVTGEDEIPYCRTEIVEAFGFKKIVRIVPGGKERYHSVYAGLCGLAEEGFCAEEVMGNDSACGDTACENPAGKNRHDGDIVLIHDGARPLVTNEIILRSMEGAAAYGACVAAMPVKDTIKVADEKEFTESTPKRSLLWQIQTPQAFTFPLIYGAYKKLFSREEYQKDITDDAMVVETMTDCKVKLIRGDYSNMKVTTPEDMAVAEALLKFMAG